MLEIEPAARRVSLIVKSHPFPQELLQGTNVIALALARRREKKILETAKAILEMDIPTYIARYRHGEFEFLSELEVFLSAENSEAAWDKIVTQYCTPSDVGHI